MRSLILPVIVAASLGFSLPSVAQPRLVSQSTVTPAKSPYIGLRYRDVPKGLTDLGGWVLGFQSNGEFRHAIARVSKGNQEMLWLNRFVGRDQATGKAFFRVVDVMNVPPMNKSQTLLGYGQCRRNGKSDPDLIAIAQVTDTEIWTTINRAWKTNRSREKFEVVSTKGVSCVNPGWGV